MFCLRDYCAFRHDCNVFYANPEKHIEKAYGGWLRASFKNVKINAGVRWLRNINIDDKVWEQDHQSQGSITKQVVPHGVERFMEVDGVMRQETDDVDGIQIHSRTSGECSDIVPQSNIGDVMNKGGPISKELEEGNIVIDPKRKRVDDTILTINCGIHIGETEADQIPTGSKNVQMVGPRNEAREGL